MERNMLPPEAAHFDESPIFTRLEIAAVAFLIGFLMLSSFPVFSLRWTLTAPLAVFLTVMIREDAFDQTVDLFILSFVAGLMFMLSAFYGQAFLFLADTIIGICFFRFLLAAASLWLTCRSDSVTVPSSDGKMNGGVGANEHPVGYVPIFMVVFVMFLGLGEAMAPPVFAQSRFAVSVANELAEFYPCLLYIGFSAWAVVEGLLWWLENKKRREIYWAFGGGDVLFLGVFSGYLGVATLLALFFLSLIARVVFFLIHFFLSSKIYFKGWFS